jgi:hydrogenase-4 component F
MLYALLILPTLAGALAFGLAGRPAARRGLLVATALLHTTLTALAWLTRPKPSDWLGLDAAGLLFLGITSVLFLAAAIYAAADLRRREEAPRDRDDDPEDAAREQIAESRFIGTLLLFLATMTLATMARHLGLLWVAIEATTLASAPLILFHRNARSLEATWKYLLVCSVGIALALLGNFFLAVAAQPAPELHLHCGDLIGRAAELDPVWLKAAFLLVLVGYGTKMGLAPLHTWLPDAHSEAPSVVSALLSGALLNCAFLGILRYHAVLAAAGMRAFSGDLLILFGLASLVTAAAFVIGQADYKRLLAYSSVEHMGILALGAGIGGLAGYGALLHAVNHSLVKAMLFMAAGNILAIFASKRVADVRGLLQVAPVTGALWMGGFLAIAGSPPFGLFVSELLILKGALQGASLPVTVIYLVALAVVFTAMGAAILRMSFGTPPPKLAPPNRERPGLLLPPLILGAGALLLGLCLPSPLAELLKTAAHLLGVD